MPRSAHRPRQAQARVGLGRCPAARQLRGRTRGPVPPAHLRARRRPAEGREIKFWFPGGSSSPVLTKDDLDVAYDFDTMARAGSMLGSGAVIVVDDSHTVLEVALKLAKFYAHESCGECVPVPRGHELDAEDAPADRVRRSNADGPRHHGVGARADHRQLPVSWETRWRCRSARWSRSSGRNSKRR